MLSSEQVRRIRSVVEVIRPFFERGVPAIVEVQADFTVGDWMAASDVFGVRAALEVEAVGGENGHCFRFVPA